MTDFINEQTPLRHSRERRFDPRRVPQNSVNPGDGMSTLTDECMGAWDWKPKRYKADPGAGKESPERIAQLEAQMPTFRGVPPGMPEQLAAERSKPRVQYGLGIEQTREQFWESSEVERRETKRAFLAHLPR